MAKAQREFESILDRPSSSIEKPKPLPVGSYKCMIVGQPREDKSSQKQTPYVEFSLKPLEAMEDVDEYALAEVLGDKALTDLVISGPPTRFYTTESAMWRLVQFLDHAQAGDEDMSTRQRLAESANKEVVVNFKHDPSQDGESVFLKIVKTARAD